MANTEENIETMFQVREYTTLTESRRRGMKIEDVIEELRESLVRRGVIHVKNSQGDMVTLERQRDGYMTNMPFEFQEMSSEQAREKQVDDYFNLFKQEFELYFTRFKLPHFGLYSVHVKGYLTPFQADVRIAMFLDSKGYDFYGAFVDCYPAADGTPRRVIQFEDKKNVKV